MKILFFAFILFNFFNLASQTSQEYFESGTTKNENNNFSGAISDFNKAIEIDPDFTYAFFNRAFSKYHLGDKRGAIADYTKAIELDPSDPETYFNRGIIYKEMIKIMEAKIDFSKVIELNPKHAEAYYQRGWCKLLLLDDDAGCNDLSTAGELGYQPAYETIKEYCNY